MPANQRQPATTQAPASPNAKATARYTNKDGSKIITVPKGPPSAEPSQPSTPTSSTKALPSHPPNDMSTNGPPQGVNRKKQKRRAKAAAKAAAAAVAVDSPLSPTSESAPATGPDDLDDAEQDDDAEPSRDDDDRDDDDANGVASAKSKKSKKKKKKGVHAGATNGPSQADALPSGPAPSASAGAGFSKEKIWNTSSQEERERIKEFWLGLGEEDRKSLVKVEKDAVLKKMKEQQKHTCSCTVCGRKRIAIEEELEGLYDAYYEELESFANQPDGPPLPRDFPGRNTRLPPPLAHQHPSRGRIVEHVTDDEDENEEYVDYSEAEFEDDDSRPESSVDGHDHDHDHDHNHGHGHDHHHHHHDHDHDHEHEPPGHRRPHPADFLTFGNSLQVKGGILTVADDLLKNDGKRFIEMMEQLAERRMAREEDAREHLAHGYMHPVNGSYANHPHIEEEFDEEDEEEDEYDSQDDEYEDEEETAMSEEQRMEEGRRMFQIFAARMFEQRVLTAYRNMVAKQRQDQLLEELAEEQRLDAQRKAKKAKDAQKRKDKAALKKQQQAEDRARRDAEKAAEEAAKADELRRRAEEQRLRAEEKRRKKEEQKRIEEEERLRKEAERQKRVVEQQEKRAEQERKIREARDKEKRLKDEARLREREARDHKEKELREKKERQDQDKRDREARLKAERDSKVKADKDARERAKEEKAVAAAAVATAVAAQKVAAAVSPAPPPAAVPAPLQTSRRPSQPVASGQPTVLPQHPPNPAAFASPKVPVATPALPKAPTPMRTKNAGASQETSTAGSQGSQPGSLHSQNPSPHSATPAHPGAHPFLQTHKSGGILPNFIPHSQSVSPPNVQIPVGHANSFHMPPGMSQPPGFGGLPPGLGQRGMPFDPGFPQMGMRPPPGMQMPPGFNGGGGRGFPPPPGFAQPFGGEPMPLGGPPPGTQHVRQSSGGFDTGSPGPSQPIGRPTPNGRAGSIPNHRPGHNDESMEQLLGSSALLDGSEEPPIHPGPGSLPRHQAPGSGPRQAFLGGPFGFDGGLPLQNDPWRSPVPGPFPPFGAPGSLGSQAATWGTPIASLVPPVPMPPVPAMNPFRPSGNPRSVTMRLMLCHACKDLQAKSVEGVNSFTDLASVVAEVDQLNRTARVSNMITEAELLDIAETEGTLQNGGGSFQIKRDGQGPDRHVIRWVPEPTSEIPMARRPVGQIGSPVIGGGAAAFSSRGS